jgi:RNA polymerase sigma factor (sigma-70 family)
VTGASRDLKSFIAACARGDAAARAAFQEAYGAVIYTFPVRIYHLSRDEAGDFYLYVFDKDRIFKRSSTFEGRNAIQFETYLSHYVLRDLFLEWRRTMERVETISLEAPVAGNEAQDERPRTVQDVLPAAEPTPAMALEASDAAQEVHRVLSTLEAEKRLVLKLVALGTIDLELGDVRALAHIAGRSIRETLMCLEDITTALAEKAMHVQDKWQTFHTVAYWIQTYQRQLRTLEAPLRASRDRGDTTALRRLEHDQEELERKLAWRYQQQARLREELQKGDIRPSYKDLARLLNMPLGTICSKIARAREEFGQQLAMARGVQI